MGEKGLDLFIGWGSPGEGLQALGTLCLERTSETTVTCLQMGAGGPPCSPPRPLAILSCLFSRAPKGLFPSQPGHPVRAPSPTSLVKDILAVRFLAGSTQEPPLGPGHTAREPGWEGYRGG